MVNAQITTIKTRYGETPVYSDCRVKVHDLDLEIQGIDDIGWLLPRDFSAQQWNELTVEEQFFSVRADRDRLLHQKDRLERKLSESNALLWVAAATVAVLFILLVFY